jgi:MraZ protein
VDERAAKKSQFAALFSGKSLDSKKPKWLKVGRCGAKYCVCPAITFMATESTTSIIYSGDYRHALDAKKRITIPSKWRSEKEEDFYVIPHQKELCLLAMPLEEFQRVPETLKASGVSLADQRIFTRRFFSEVQSCTTDKQGRLLLPEGHCKKAGLQDEVVLVGSNARFEIWNPEAWNQWINANQENYERVSEIAGL